MKVTTQSHRAVSFLLGGETKARILSVLRESDARSIGDLADRIGMSKTSTGAAVRALESAGVLVSVARGGRHELCLNPRQRVLVDNIVALEAEASSNPPVPSEEMTETDWDAVAAYYAKPLGVVVPAGVTEWHPDEEGLPISEAAWAGRGPLD